MTGDLSVVGLRVLVVEDEALLSMLVEDALVDLGCVVVGPYMRLEPAMAVVRDEAAAIGVAVLDVNVAGEWSFPLAELLLRRGVPVIFTTGYDEAAIDERWRALPILRKPFSDEELKRIIGQVARARDGRRPD